MILAHALQQLFPNASPRTDYILQDDGEGVYVKEWNLPDPQPTEAELEAAWNAWLADQPVRDAQTLILQQAADFTDLPEWATYTTAEAVTAIHNAIGNGNTLAVMKTQIDNLPNTVAGMKTGLKAVADDVVAIRGLLEKMAKVIVYLRDRTQ